MPNDDETQPFSEAQRAAFWGELLPGTHAGEYVIEGSIARGGYGAVYAARHRRSSRCAALKVLNDAAADSPRAVERFQREVEVLERLSHPNIVEIYEIGALDDGRPFYAMERLEGRTLDAWLRSEKRLSPVEVLEILEPVCAALDSAHAAGVVHRDVKASNIFIVAGRPRSVKLLDFGIAKLLGNEVVAGSQTTVGRPPGTPSIMAPEQILGAPIDARVDVYALGVLLHRMLTGRLPFSSSDATEMLRKHLEEPPLPPSLRTPLAPALDTVVLRCLEKRPERRFGSVKEMMRALREAVGKPSRGRESLPEQPSLGVAVYVEVQTRAGGGDELDDALACDIGLILDMAEELLSHAGFSMTSTAGNVVLGVRLLAGDAALAREERRAAIELARALHQSIAAREGADARVHVNVCVHADKVDVRPAAQPEILGGALMCTATWAPRGEVRGVYATPSALAELSSVERLRGPGAVIAGAPGEPRAEPVAPGIGDPLTIKINRASSRPPGPR